MQPVRRDELRPDASDDEVAEYQRLMSERFSEDPDLMGAPPQKVRESAERESRLTALYEKLFRRPVRLR